MIRRIILSLVLILGTYLLYAYTFQGVEVATVGASVDSLGGPSVVYWVVFWLIMSMALSGLLVTPNSRIFRIGIHAYVILLVSQLVLGTVLLSEDIYRFGYTMVASIGGESIKPPRNPLVSQLGLVLAAVPFVSFVYGMWKGKYRYTVHRHTLFFADLPKAFDGFTITQISDIHAGSFDDPLAVQRGIDLINQQNSDLFVFTGDLVNNKANEMEPWLNHFEKIRAPEGKFSILGNHDYGDYISWPDASTKFNNLQQLKNHHATIGCTLLLDEHVTLSRGDERIRLLGVENWGVGFGKRGDLASALHGTSTSDFKILLSHDPSHWEHEVKHHSNPIHLTLSGHTHGMQFGIEKFGIKWSPVKLRYKHWAGLAEHAGRYLYISRGFGFLGFSGRVGIWPEITVIELRRRAN